MTHSIHQGIKSHPKVPLLNLLKSQCNHMKKTFRDPPV
nr:MAG TPA: hypothetical protein [Caudoviricetes sp.]